MMPTRADLRVAGVAVQTFLRTVAKVVGSEVVDDVVAFFRAFEGMEQGFRDRAAVGRAAARATRDRVRARHVAPARRRRRSASSSRTGSRERGLAVAALVVNRVHPAFGTETAVRAPGPRRRAAGSADHRRAGPTAAAAPGRAVRRTSPTSASVAARERDELAGVARRGSAPRPSRTSPYLAHDVHDFDALAEVGRHLFAATGCSVTSAARLACRADDDDPRGRRRPWVRDQVQVRVRRPRPEGRRGHPRPGRPRHGGDEEPDLVILDMQIGNMGGVAVGPRPPPRGVAAGRLPDVLDPAAPRPRGRPVPRQAGRRRRRCS